MKTVAGPIVAIADIARNLVYLKGIKRIDRVYSDTAYSDLHALFLLARDGWGTGSIVEIGSFHGKSTVCLALGSAMAGREDIVAIDPHTTESRRIFTGTIGAFGLASRVVPVMRRSEDARKEFHAPIRLLFVDGDHSYEAVKLDIALWKDLVIDGGVVVFHDLNWKTVFKALEEFLASSPEYIIEGSVGCSLMLSKGSSKSAKVFDEVRLFNRIKGMMRPRRGGSPEEALVAKLRQVRSCG